MKEPLAQLSRFRRPWPASGASAGVPTPDSGVSGASRRTGVWRNAADAGPSGAVRARAGAPSRSGAASAASGAAAGGVSDDGPHQPVDRKGGRAEEQVAGHPGARPRPDVPAAVRVPGGGVHPPGAGALPVARAVVADVARAAPRPRPGGGALPQLRVAAGVCADDRHAARQAGARPGLPGVTVRVHQPVAVVHPLRGHPGEGEGGLSVVQRRRGQDAVDGDIAAGGVDMRSVPAPALPVTFRVPFRAHVAGLWKLRHHLRRGHAAPELPLQTRRLPDRAPALPGASAPPLRRRLPLRRGPLPSHDRRRVPGYVADGRAVMGGPDQSPVHAPVRPRLREPREGPGERRFAGDLRHAATGRKAAAAWDRT